ncbi:hypothetical protein P4O66_014280 [Electrophorus voltai]|uniref:LIM zinc-binding domain-containing protein n=1 Tax=Electrophorus voltai TaxID=2609070 RepID=A0AAD9DRD8_9TELE|nr:hypothetical protein P4O66_014280 [Electrophorus voltai]
MANQLLAKFEENAPSASVSAIQRQVWVCMYTGGVSVLAELVAPQLQNQQSNPKPFLDCSELGSQRREFPLSVGGSDVCYFCARRVYVMERLSAEGKFFHRSCFQCNHCNTTLRLSNYAYDQLQGVHKGGSTAGSTSATDWRDWHRGRGRHQPQALTLHRYYYRMPPLTPPLSGAPTIPPGPPVAPLSSPRHTHALPPSESCGSASASPVAAWRRAKRPCGTPERIGLENCSSSPQEQDSLLQEVPEETQAQHNLSVSLQEEGNEEQSSSSESELEEEGEVLLETEEEPQAWTNRKAELDNGAERKEDEQKREEDEDERGDEEHCKEEDVSEGEVWESSDEGEYCPWEREQHSGVWLEEEEVGMIKKSRECGEHSDDPEVKPHTDRKVKSCDVQQQNVHSDESLVSESPPTPLTYPTRTSPPTSHQPGTPENSESEKSEVIVEFWLKSAEIRKSLGRTPVPRVSSPKSLDDSSTQTSIAGDVIYTSATRMPSISTAAPDYPSHPSHTSDTSSHSSGARSLSTCTCSMQTLSLTDLQRSCARSLNGTPSSSHIRTPDDVGGGEVEGAGPVLQEVADHCSVVHKLNITLQGHVTEKQGGLGSGPSSNSTTTNHNVLSTDSGLLTPPCSPPMARQRRDVHGLKPPPAGQMLVSSGSHAVPLNAGQQQRDRIKTDLERARSLPPDEVEVLCAGDANEELPSPATPAQLPRGIATVSSTPGLPAETHGPAPQPSGIDKSMLEGRAMPPEGGAEVQPGPEEKEKRRSLLFSPRKSKKGGSVIGAVQQEAGKHKSLWRSVFSGYKREKKRKEVEAQASASSDSGNLESSRRMPGLSGTTDLGFRRSLSFSEEADVSCTERCPLRMQKAGSEEELDEKLTRRVQRAARRQAKQEELRRLHRAQIIQRQLEQVEVKQRQLEEKGIAVEKALRGEADYWEDSSASDLVDIHLGGMGKKDDPSLMQQWFKLVQEKNALVRYESELMIFAQELELEDRQSRLQQQLRERMAVDGQYSPSYTYTQLQLHPATTTPNYTYTQLQLHPATPTPSYSYSQLHLHPATTTPSYNYTQLQLQLNPTTVTPNYSYSQLQLNPTTVTPNYSYSQLQLNPTTVTPNYSHITSTKGCYISLTLSPSLFVFFSLGPSLAPPDPSDHLKGEEELAEERRILGAMLEVVEQRDALVALLEEQRLQEREEDSDLEAVMLSKGFSLYWT